jgi:ABC-2 type transport system permease protein
VTAILAGMRFQYWWLRRNVDELQAFVLTPMFTIIFGGIVLAAGRQNLLPSAILGAALMGLWTLCIQAGGNIIEHERMQGTFEAVESTPTGLRLVVFGRVSTVIAVMALVVPEVWLVTLLVFGQAIPVPHPWLFIVAFLLTLAGLHAAAGLCAGLFVLARNVVILQNALAYPVYLLGGIVVPVSLLPHWIQPLSRLIFLSWGADLLRASLKPTPPAGIATGLLGLVITSAGLAIAGQVTFGMVVRRARIKGTLSLV